MENFSYFLMVWADPRLILLTAAGTFAGIYIGAIPGLSVTMAASILISFTFSWDTNSALALISGVFLGGVYGGSRTAILLNIPGAPSAVATALDGYPMAQRGEAGLAIGLGTIMSVIGGFVGIIALAVAAPLISRFALWFAPRDYMLLAMIGILLVGSLASSSLAKGIFAAALGVVIGLVGMDPMTAQARFTFGNFSLMGGISYVAAMIGFFGVAEVLYQLRTLDAAVVRQKVDKLLPDFSLVRKYLPLSLRSSAIGVTIGALPGTGGDIAALMAYDQARRTIKKPSHPFGQGAQEGVVAPEAANNAAVGGAYIPMLTLGIPGDAVTAIIIGALYIHGLRPGPLLMTDTPHLFWFVVGSLTLANIFLLVFGLSGIRLFAKIVELPKGIILPLIVVLAAVGTFAVQNNITDVYWMMAFGILGYFLKVYGFPVAPIILGIILGPLMDLSYRRSIISVRDDPVHFVGEFFTSPLSAVLFVAFVLLILSQTRWWGKLWAGRSRTDAAG
ncbi:tripartite tricarboxylate transporter permease [Pelagibacterium halotolerans]|uniref:Tricarboxylate transport membrane protein TctA n=1 Tax=Pelagibacterium halotolerans (strain DSM 22347 / JCM 15775 / CGMCC 1.7692 / B2) TaxID=1082931 RepID=G4R793_PELHB|nr:tripartite tricarboxylate transporter permease [Pelagibacterium halotolerans]AEQ51229.1 tricarboxylate transport membrane protein TctA [Pelagibacterium halotolerans B2]QJR18908.1 tripartite tricarboxylate transporter permease [Pelagibacterium halotolerans]SEA67804.1 putative tricarboxylic transport membrane protein [Pelagibacterium halotolerans]